MPKKFPCHTTRCFNAKIHPKAYPNDLATFRMQIRKHPKLPWKVVAMMLQGCQWEVLWKESRMCHRTTTTLVATFRFQQHPR